MLKQDAHRGTAQSSWKRSQFFQQAQLKEISHKQKGRHATRGKDIENQHFEKVHRSQFQTTDVLQDEVVKGDG